ncbi:MAG: family 16 glycosylhydrolase [Candidatus Izemoplasmatales bacterium]
MKKIMILFIFLLFGFFVGCQAVSDTTTYNTTSSTENITSQTTTNITNTTSSYLYDDRSLVPDSCDFLENIDDWQPVWCDEFDVDGLPDSSKWSYDVGGSGWGNNELQYYTEADLDNARVSDGLLYITALKESIDTREYSSSRLVSKYRGDWQYGRIQIRAKMPSGRGLWSALWMLPTDWNYGGWPNSGEIDIMEYVGYDKNQVYGTIHTGAYNHSLGTQIGFDREVLNVETEFQVYEMIWEPGKIDLYINGEKFAFFGYNPNTNIDISNPDAWPFDQRFHLIMNIAVGGNWGGLQGVDDSIFPQSMVVDYVRVYQKDYAGLDREKPSAVSDLELQKTTTNSIQIKWDHSVDDVSIEKYNIFLNGVLEATTTVNGILLTRLDPETEYVIDVVALDFAGNRSDSMTLTAETLPVPSILGTIQAEFYTNSNGIKIETTTDVGGGKNVGWIDSEDFLTYYLKVDEAGTYNITYRVASETGGGQIRLFVGFKGLVSTNIDSTGGWQVWTDVISDNFELEAGVYTFTLRAIEGGFNLNYFSFKKVD